jgi:hypothetical protein
MLRKKTYSVNTMPSSFKGETRIEENAFLHHLVTIADNRILL